MSDFKLRMFDVYNGIVIALTQDEEVKSGVKSELKIYLFI